MRLYYNNAAEGLAEDWVRVSAIVDFPEITTRKDIYGLCVVSLRDFEGELYSTWEPRDLTEMKVTDDAETPNTLFRGYLINKRFSGKDLVLEIAGIGIRLYRRSFGSEEIKNYILEDGFVKTVNANTQIDLQRWDNNGDPDDFDWIDDKWVLGDKDVGLIIKDNTAGFTDVDWDCEDPIVQAGGEVQGGTDFEDTHEFDDENYYEVRDGTDTSDLIITATMEGDLIPDTNTIKEIQIEYNYRLKIKSTDGGGWTRATLKLEIKKGDEWIPLDSVYAERNALFDRTHTTGWVQAISSDFKEGGSPHIIYEEGEDKSDDVELRKYFTKVGADYDSIELRFSIDGTTGAGGWYEAHVDYLRIVVTYHEFTGVEPIMITITDSGNTGNQRWVKCASVPNWQEKGITDYDAKPSSPDTFQIGENTRQIIQDIMSEAGLNYEIIDPHNIDSDSNTIDPDADGVVNWQTTGGTHFGELIDDNGATMVWAANGDEGLTEIFTFPNTITLTNGYVDRIRLNIDCRKQVGVSNPTLSIYVNEAWSDEEEFIPPAISDTVTVDFDGIWRQDDIDALQIRFTAPNTIPPATDCRIFELSVTVRELYPNFNKYMALKFKGKHCIEPLQSVCKLEGAHWIEDYINNRIVIIKPADYVDSEVDLTQSNYGPEWEIEDQCNQVKYVYVWGKPSINEISQTTTNIFAKAVSTTATGHKSLQIVDDNIMTNPAAQTIANTQLALLETKRPSIRIPLEGVNIALQLGTTVGLTMARPTVENPEGGYPIRMIQRSKFGKTGIKTIVYAGLGETDWDEKIFKELKRLDLEVHKALTDKLESTPYDVGVGGITWGDVGGGPAGAVEAVLADDKYIKNYESDVMDGDLTVNNLITAGLVDSVDVSDLKTAFDALSYYTQAELNAGQLNNIYYTETEVNDNTYTRAQVDAHNWLEADITDLDKYTEAEVNGLLHTEGHVLATTGPHTGTLPWTDLNKTGSNLTDLATRQHAGLTDITANQHHVAFVQGDADALYSVLAHLHDDRYYTEGEIGNKVFEQSAAFPGAPSEGDFHYDEDDDSLYRYNGEAGKWVEVGVMGAIASEVDNLGNHTATEDLDMDTNKVLNMVDPTTDQGGATKKYVDDAAKHRLISDDIAYSNDTVRSKSSTSYTKIKEIRIGYDMEFRLYWEAKCAATATNSKTRVYINGVAQGSEHTNNTDEYVAFTEDLEVSEGDYVQIYGYAYLLDEPPIARACYVANMRIKFVHFAITEGF